MILHSDVKWYFYESRELKEDEEKTYQPEAIDYQIHKSIIIEQMFKLLSEVSNEYILI